VILTSNTTTALDIASYLMGNTEGATLVSNMEHHSNDLTHRRKGEVLRILVCDDGTLDYDDLESKLKNNRVKLVAVTGASNVTGYMPDIHRIARMSHEHGAKILVDGAQLLAHHSIDMRPNDADDHIDFLAAAGHKMYAPFGAAFLVASCDAMNAMPPYIPGGGTVEFVTYDDALWVKGVERHCGGTPNIGGVIALGASLKWLAGIGMDWIRQHELELLKHVEGGLRQIEGVTILGNIPADQKLGVLPFNVRDLHHEDVSWFLNDEFGIATRNGCFCAHPYLTQLLKLEHQDAEDIRRKIAAGEEVILPGAVRATIGIFNNEEDMDKLVEAVTLLASPEGLERIRPMMAGKGMTCTEVG
jgi:selenocysteine lyase/cysteine desulfurase